MMRAPVSSRSCFSWLYRASPSSVTKNIINLILVLTIWWCSCVESSLVLLGKDDCYDQHVDRTLLAFQFSSVQSLSRVRLSATPWITARQASLSITISQSSLKFSCVQLFVTPWIAAHQASQSITISRSSLKTHVHRVRDAIQPSHPLSSPSPPAENFSQHQGLFQWVSSSHQVAKVLEFQLQDQSFQWTPRTGL